MTSVESEVLGDSLQTCLQLFVVAQIPGTTSNSLKSQYQKTALKMNCTCHSSILSGSCINIPPYNEEGEDDRG